MTISRYSLQELETATLHTTDGSTYALVGDPKNPQTPQYTGVSDTVGVMVLVIGFYSMERLCKEVFTGVHGMYYSTDMECTGH